MILQKAYYGRYPVVAVYYGRYLIPFYNIELVEYSGNLCLKIGSNTNLVLTDINAATADASINPNNNIAGSYIYVSNPENINRKIKIVSTADGTNGCDKDAMLNKNILIKSIADALVKDMSGGKINGDVSPIGDMIGHFSNSKCSPIKGDISVQHIAESCNADAFTSPVTANTEIRHHAPAFNAAAKGSPIKGNNSVQHIAETDKSDTNGALPNGNIYAAHAATGETDQTTIAAINVLMSSFFGSFGVSSDSENASVCSKIQNGNDIYFTETSGKHTCSIAVIKLNSSAISEFLHTVSSDMNFAVAPSSCILPGKNDTSVFQASESVSLGAAAHAETVDTERYKYPALLSFAEGDEHTVSVLIELSDEYPVDNVSEPERSEEDNYIIEIIQEEN